MALADLRLALMTFAQRWENGSLFATALVLPSGDPAASPLGAGTPAFAGHNLRLRAGIIGSLDALPALDAALRVPLVLKPPDDAETIFAHLAAKFAPRETLSPSGVPGRTDRIRKALPHTYARLLAPGSELDGNVATADDFGCTLRSQRPAEIDPAAHRHTSWGAVLSHALRNPNLADALGLRYEFRIDAPESDRFADGGWLFVTLDPADPYFAVWDTVQPDAVKVYAARIPALKRDRQLFTAVLFPVANPKGSPTTPDESEIDRAIVEAEIYSDGFAELMHARQPDSLDAHVGDGKVAINPATDAGIQIGWDDQQVLIWHNRQLEIAGAQRARTEPKLEAPLGVLGYRVDVRVPVAGELPADKNTGWQSLMVARGTVPDALTDRIPPFQGELTIEPTPTSPPHARDFWLPLYFAQWRGTPLGTRDDTPHLLAGGTAAKHDGAIQLKPSSFRPEAAPIPLRYGTKYEFRTRLADLTGGGPRPGDNPIDEAVAERAAVTFSRWVAPKGLRITPVCDPPHDDPHVDRLVITRPLIGYPEALFTWRYGSDPNVAAATTAALLAQLGMKPDGTPPAAPPATKNTVVSTGVPDPDVDRLAIDVEVRALAHERADDVTADGAFVAVYSTTRKVPPLAPIVVPALGDVDPRAVATDVAIPPLELDYVDTSDIGELKGEGDVLSGALKIPCSRDVRIRVTPIATAPAGAENYFGTFAGTSRVPVEQGTTSSLLVRANAQAEAAEFFTGLSSAHPNVQALFFQPHTDGDPVAGLMNDLAAQLELEADGMTLRARPGERVLFGATGFTNTISADGGSITFASAKEIFRQWTVAVQYALARDWTWDGLLDRGSLPPVPDPAVERFLDRAIHVVNRMPDGYLDSLVEIGHITVPRIASAQAVSGDPDRTRTRLVFLHGIDPTVPNANDGFTERLPYEFVAGLRDDAGGVLQLESVPVAVKLPVATPPDGVPKLASAGYALSKYEPLDHYSHTLPRQRQLWLECAESPAPGDGLFARVLAYAPDPLLYTDAQLELTPPGEDPPLKLDPELMRVITHGQPTDSDGLEAMVELTASADDPKTFLLPLPEGVDEHDPRLFGMWTYELRFGHTKPWSLAHARFGRPLRVTGIQHPAPELPCVASWERRESLTDNEAARRGIAVHTRFQLVASAPYATPVTEDGRRVGSGFPHTTIGFLLYAQAIQADGSGYRNVLIAHAGATPVRPRETQDGFVYDYGSAIFVQTEIEAVLYDHGLPLHAPLSVVAVEFYAPGGSIRGDREAFFSERAVNAARAGAADDPFGPESFGKRRILRTSPLVKVEPYC